MATHEVQEPGKMTRLWSAAAMRNPGVWTTWRRSSSAAAVRSALATAYGHANDWQVREPRPKVVEIKYIGRKVAEPLAEMPHEGHEAKPVSWTVRIDIDPDHSVTVTDEVLGIVGYGVNASEAFLDYAAKAVPQPAPPSADEVRAALLASEDWAAQQQQ